MSKTSANNPGVFDSLPRAQMIFGDSLARYSDTVYRLKLILPGLALLVLLSLMVWPQLMDSDNRFTLGGDNIAAQAPAASVIIGPRYVGNNGQGLAYHIAAKTARPDATNPQAVNLDQLSITVEKGESRLDLVADRATYWRDRNGIAAQGDIVLRGQDGQSIRTNAAFADFKAATIWGDSDVVGQTHTGTFSGQGFIARQDGSKIELRGQVRVSLLPRSGKL